MLGGLVLAVGGLFGLVAYELYGFRALPEGEPLATVTFHSQGNGTFEAEIVQDDERHLVLVEGDLWQLQLRALQWKGPASLIGLEPGYQLAQLSGRYMAVEQQALARLPNARLSPVPAELDLWQRLSLDGHDLLIVEPRLHRSERMPMADGARFTLSMAPTGLLIEPVNMQASDALARW